MLVCAFFAQFCTRDRGCSAHPAFPAPSFLRDHDTQTSGDSRREIADMYLLFEIRMNSRLVSNDGPYSGTALSPRPRESFEANDASTIIAVIKAIARVQMALISGFTPNRTSE